MSDMDDHTQKTPAGRKRERPMNRDGDLQFAAGDIISGVYEVISFIGSGGMSNVYKCKDISIDRVVAVKALQSGYTPESLRRFQTEGRAIAKLEHPNIVKLYGLQHGVDDEPVLVMEYIPGLTLHEILKKDPNLPTERVLNITAQICEALKASERAGIVHRDLKPSNIMLTNPGTAGECVKILDFGIAKIRDNTAGDVTKTGDIFGTPNYMSPEQALGKKCDARADQYALGCILFEMLSGRPPFTSENILSVILMHVQSPIPSLNEAATRHLPGNLGSVVRKMLQKKPDDRYSSFEEVADAILNIEQNSSNSSRKVVIYTVIPIVFLGLMLFLLYRLNIHAASHLPVRNDQISEQIFDRESEMAAKSAASVDNKLNTIYGEVVRKFQQNSTFKAHLLISEKAWMSFRDAHLNSIYPEANKPGRTELMQSMCFEEALAEVTAIRTKQLAKVLTGSIEPVLNVKKSLALEEKLLNETYSKALANYRHADAKYLREAEVKWLAFREAESNMLATLAQAGDTELVKLSTELALDRQRTTELNEWVEGVKNGNVCAGTRIVH